MYANANGTTDKCSDYLLVWCPSTCEYTNTNDTKDKCPVFSDLNVWI